MIQLSKARLSTSLKIHSRNSTSRGEISARSANRQPKHPMRRVLPVAPAAASSACLQAIARGMPETTCAA